MNNITLILIILILIIPLQIFPESTEKDPDWCHYTFRNKFTFDYPCYLEIKENSPVDLTLMDEEKIFIEIHLLLPDECTLLYDFYVRSTPDRIIPADTMQTIFRDRILLYNMADGPDGSYFATNYSLQRDCISPHGLRILQATLTGNREDSAENTLTLEELGPYYGLELPANDLLIIIIGIYGQSVPSSLQTILTRMADSLRQPE